MATKKDFVQRVIERLEPLDVTAKPMFGEYGLYYKGKMFGLLCDDTFFIRITDRGSALAGRISKGFPYPGARPAFKITSAKSNDHKWLTELVEATASELPLPKKKKKVQ